MIVSETVTTRDLEILYEVDPYQEIQSKYWNTSSLVNQPAQSGIFSVAFPGLNFFVPTLNFSNFFLNAHNSYFPVREFQSLRIMQGNHFIVVISKSTGASLKKWLILQITCFTTVNAVIAVTFPKNKSLNFSQGPGAITFSGLNKRKFIQSNQLKK